MIVLVVFVVQVAPSVMYVVKAMGIFGELDSSLVHKRSKHSMI